MTAPYTPALIDAQIAAARERLAAARTFRAEIDTLRGRASSRDRAVTVSVDASGLLLDVDFSDPLPSARDLRRVLLETLREAQQDVAGRAKEAARETFGATSATAAHVEDELATRFAPVEVDGGGRGSGAGGGLGRGGRYLQ